MKENLRECKRMYCVNVRIGGKVDNLKKTRIRSSTAGS